MQYYKKYLYDIKYYSQRNAKVTTYYPVRKMNVCAIFHGSPSKETFPPEPKLLPCWWR